MNFAEIIRAEMARRSLTKKQFADELRPRESGWKKSGVGKSVLYDFLQVTDPPNRINSDSLARILDALDFQLVNAQAVKRVEEATTSSETAAHATFQPRVRTKPPPPPRSIREGKAWPITPASLAEAVRTEMRQRCLSKRQLAVELRPTVSECGPKKSGVSKTVLYDFLQVIDPPNHINSESLGRILEALDFQLVQGMVGMVYKVHRLSGGRRNAKYYAVCKTKAEAEKLAAEETKSSGMTAWASVEKVPAPPKPPPPPEWRPREDGN